ncbi:MAG: oxidoreductase [Chloroflexi bacterium]|nr:oxidoreductase [Chloroflexota bacterium]
MPRQVVHVGLIGYGYAGQVFHAPIIDTAVRLQLTTIVSSNPGKVTRDFSGVQVMSDVSALFSDAHIDLIVIATPNTTHFPLAQQALAAGKHVVIDKPFVIDTTESDILINLAAQTGAVLSVFHNRRWDNDYRTLTQLVKQGELGDVYTFQSHYDRHKPTVRDRWREWDEPGAGLLYDLGSHLIDQAVQLLGMPDSVWADLGCQRAGAQIDDYFHVVLRFGERRAILHGGSLVAQPPFRFAVHGSKGSYIKHGLDPQEAALLAGERPCNPGWGVEPKELHGELFKPNGESASVPSLRGRYEDFYAGMARAILEGERAPVTAVSARNVIAIIQAAQESAQTGQTIALSGRLREEVW